jgi:hypothetical protein
MKTYQPDDIVKSCQRLESGLRFSTEAIYACNIGAGIFPPPYASAEEARSRPISKAMLIEKRRQLFEMLNDATSDIFCKHCAFVIEKPFREVRFDQLGHLDLAHYTTCNLRCSFCSYTVTDNFIPAQYDALKILQEFSPEDSQWDALINFNGGEPSILKDLKQYLDLFAKNRIRILLYTNAVRYRQEIYDSIKSGAISWLVVGLDAGTPSTFDAMKKSTKFQVALDNITRYAHAGSFGRGSVAVKYVFCKDNSSLDDALGFAYAMLAIRPQKVWLTVDYTPPIDTADARYDYEKQAIVGGYDYTPLIEAYARTYVTLKRHGMDAVHYVEQHGFSATPVGNQVFERIKARIAELLPPEENTPLLLLQDFRIPPLDKQPPRIRFDFSPLRQITKDKEIPWSLAGKRIMIAAIWRNSIALLADPDIQKSDFIGFLDRNPALTGTRVHGHLVFNYDQLADLKPDIIIIDASKQNQQDIAAAITRILGENVTLAFLARETDESSLSRWTGKSQTDAPQSHP